MKKKITVFLGMIIAVSALSCFATMADEVNTKNTENNLKTKLIATDIDNVDISGLENGMIPYGIYKYKVIANNVNVRESPSTSAKSYGQMNWGDVCYSSAFPVSGDGLSWLYVICGSPLTGTKGYIATQYLQEVAD